VPSPSTAGRSLSGSRTARWSLRVETLISISSPLKNLEIEVLVSL
jgi:hypothetical protein